MKHTLIVGYGQLGSALCEQLLNHGQQVTTISRKQHAVLSKHHQHLQIDLDNETNPIEITEQLDTLCYFAPPSDTDLTDQRLTQFLLALQSPVAHIIYISTSGVYGDCAGQLIDEQYPTKPSASRSKRRLDAEQQLVQFNKSTSTAVTILRCAAIYSSNTVNRKRIAANTRPVINQNQAPYTNRIHLEDLVEVCVCAIKNTADGIEIYNVSDGHASTTTDHAWLLSDLAGLKRMPEIAIEDADQYYSPAYISYLNESKRLDITKLKKNLKPVFKFASISDGIIYCLR
ncbi:MAG: NAD-dependent epimerase/dehydratase family protein [Gammaproteobacteria bacterium]|nr:NAD-dependent epimerase/dehydratase family protein [Gammaproteobacteria bacterium]